MVAWRYHYMESWESKWLEVILLGVCAKFHNNAINTFSKKCYLMEALETSGITKVIKCHILAFRGQ